MKEITLKFEVDKDYERFITEIIEPTVEKYKVEFDKENNILLIKNQE